MDRSLIALPAVALSVFLAPAALATEYRSSGSGTCTVTESGESAVTYVDCKITAASDVNEPDDDDFISHFRADDLEIAFDGNAIDADTIYQHGISFDRTDENDQFCYASASSSATLSVCFKPDEDLVGDS